MKRKKIQTIIWPGRHRTEILSVSAKIRRSPSLRWFIIMTVMRFIPVRRYPHGFWNDNRIMKRGDLVLILPRVWSHARPRLPQSQLPSDTSMIICRKVFFWRILRSSISSVPAHPSPPGALPNRCNSSGYLYRKRAAGQRPAAPRSIRISFCFQKM